MDINYLKEFLVLAEVGNYLEAAENLFLSQPTLSKHIKSLEEELGVPLFDRTTRKVVLNKYGELFLPYVKKITELQLEYEAAFQGLCDLDNTTLSIGTIPMMAQYGIIDLLAKIQRENPSLTINLKEGDPATLMRMLNSGQSDFGFIREENSVAKQLVKIPIDEDYLVAVLPDSHPLSKKSSISLHQLRDEKLMLPIKDTDIYRLIVGACHNAGFEPKTLFSSVGAASSVDMVSKGMGGAALFMRKACQQVKPKSSGVVYVDIEPKVIATVYLAYKPKTTLRPASQAFLSTLHNMGYHEKEE